MSGDPSWEEAERVSGYRLDRRRTYVVLRGRVWVGVRFVSKCSGCDGGGCTECGHTGRRRSVEGVPLEYSSHAIKGVLD